VARMGRVLIVHLREKKQSGSCQKVLGMKGDWWQKQWERLSQPRSHAQKQQEQKVLCSPWKRHESHEDWSLHS
jgi:hypothetical protein